MKVSYGDDTDIIDSTVRKPRRLKQPSRVQSNGIMAGQIGICVSIK